MNPNVYDDAFEDYIDNVLSISALSDKNHYIFYKFNIKDNVCFDEIYMLNQDGEKGEFGKKNFNYSDEFYEKFLKKLVEKFHRNNSIISVDVIFDNDEGTFRMITDNKDIFTISGLSKDKNDSLLNMVKNEDHEDNKEYVLTNNTGKINYLILVFIILLVLFVLSLVILL